MPWFEKTAAVITPTLIQLTTLFGPVFALGLVIHLLSRFTSDLAVRILGFEGWRWTFGLVGTVVHELGHLIMCPLFGHKIVDFQLFSFEKNAENMGFVEHTYSKANPWSQIGRLFISLGPILLGAGLIYGLLWLLLPQAATHLTRVRQALLETHVGPGTLLLGQKDLAIAFMKNVFSAENLVSWKFWLFLYLNLCIVNHMELSPEDLKGAAWGLLATLFILLLFNTANLFWFHGNPETLLARFTTWSSWLTAILVFASLLSASSLLIFLAVRVPHALISKTASGDS